MNHKELKEIFDLYTSHKTNWKESHTVIFKDHVNTEETHNSMLDDANNVAEAFTYFCGGYEWNHTAENEIIVSTNGYYYYIGA